MSFAPHWSMLLYFEKELGWKELAEVHGERLHPG